MHPNRLFSKRDYSQPDTHLGEINSFPESEREGLKWALWGGAVVWWPIRGEARPHMNAGTGPDVNGGGGVRVNKEKIVSYGIGLRPIREEAFPLPPHHLSPPPKLIRARTATSLGGFPFVLEVHAEVKRPSFPLLEWSSPPHLACPHLLMALSCAAPKLPLHTARLSSD